MRRPADALDKQSLLRLLVLIPPWGVSLQAESVWMARDYLRCRLFLDKNPSQISTEVLSEALNGNLKLRASIQPALEDLEPATFQTRIEEQIVDKNIVELVLAVLPPAPLSYLQILAELTASTQGGLSHD